MGELSDRDVKIYGGDGIFAEMMAAMSILSDAQELLSHKVVSREVVNDEINHGKYHLSNAMQEYHRAVGLPGKLMTFGKGE